MSELPPEPVSRLRWYPDRGFELDLNATLDDLALTLVAVPVPADGTVELRAGPIELDPLEILFKAQVDLDGVPGQLTSASIQVRSEDDGDWIDLHAQVEDAETGDRQDIAVSAPLVVPASAPESGGPRPRPKDESELDWDDDDTIEAYLKDPLTQEDPLPVAERRRPSTPVPAPPSAPADDPGAKRQEKGFNRLMQMLMRDDDALDEDLDDDLSDEAPAAPAAPSPSPSRSASPPSARRAVEERPAEVIPMVRDPGDARGLLRYLVDQEQLELEDGFDIEDLLAGAAPIMASAKPADARAQALSEWLFTQDAVAEVYIDDDALAALIDQW